jgi:Na+-transporting methylmalonyl-CoA/oxaloacetate decarboxylase gamma subunit
MSILVSHAACLAVLAYTRILGDSEGPPVDRTGQTFVLVIVGIGVVIVVLLSVVTLRGLTRSRRARWSEREYQAQRAQGEAAETGDGSVEPPEES